jgi:hypothetical protein
MNEKRERERDRRMKRRKGMYDIVNEYVERVRA